MRIKNLYLENFKSIKQLNLDFGNKRIILLEGDAGQGKTSILEAIVYILTNDLNEKIEEFKRLKKFDFKIKCEFDHLGKEYQIEIESTKSGVNKNLIIDNKDSFVNSNATKKLAEIINPIITKYSAVSEQEKSTILLFEKPAPRLQKFKQLFGIDNINFIVKKIKEDIVENKNQKDIIDAEVKILKGKIFTYQEVPNIIDNEEELKNTISLLEKDKEIFEGLNKLYLTYLRELNYWEEKQKQILSINLNIIDWKKEIDLFNGQLKQEIEYDDLLLSKLQEEIHSIEKEKIQYDNLFTQYIESQKRISIFNLKINDLKERQKKFEQIKIEPCEYTEKDLEECNTLFSFYSVEISKLYDQIKLVKQGKCPTCGQEYKGDLNSLELKVKEIDIKMTEIQDKAVLINTKIKRNNESIQLNEKNKIKWDADENAINDSLEQIKNLEKFIKPELKVFNNDEIKIKIEKQKKLKKEREDIQIFNLDINKKINNLQNKIELIKNQIKEYEKINKPTLVDKPIEFDTNHFERLKNSLLILQQKKLEVERIRSYNESIRTEKTKNERLILSKENSLEKLNKTNRELDKAKDVLDKDFSAFVIDRGTNFIKTKMNDFFRRAYSRFEITFEQDKSSIEFFYNEPGEIARPVTMASGFEKQILSISCRTAMCQMQNLGIMIADEIDSNAGSKDSLKLFNILLNEKSFNQFLVITHNDEVKEMIEQRDDSIRFSLKNGTIAV